MIEILAWGDSGWGDEMVRGTFVTLSLALTAYALGLGFGLLGAWGKIAGPWWVRGVAEVYTTVIRGIPELLVIYLLFFGGGQAVMQVARVFGYTGFIDIPGFVIGAIAVGLISGAYSTEVFRGAILAVPRGQIEAAKACGMAPVLMFRRVMVPQIMRFALPGLGNVWQLTLKDTALVSVTGLAELMRTANVAGGSERDFFTFYITAAALYLLMTTVSNAIFDRGETWANRGVRRV